MIGSGEGGGCWRATRTRISLVCVLSQIASLSDVQVRLGDDLVERVGAAGELLAGVAVAGWVSCVSSV